MGACLILKERGLVINMAKSKWTNTNTAKELISRILNLKLSKKQQYPDCTGHNEYDSLFAGTELNLYTMLLTELVRFDNEIPEPLKSEITMKAIFESADKDQLHHGYLAQVIKRQEKEYLNNEKQKFILITGVSIIGIKTKHIVHTPNSLITISKYFPKKYKSEYDFKEVTSICPKINPKAFSWVTIEVSARCISSAVSTALTEFDYWLGIMNVFFNFNQSRQSFEQPSPINKIIKYPYHSLHFLSGKRATNLYWYEPNYSLRGSIVRADDQYIKAKRFYNMVSSKISKTSQIKFFRDALSRYCDALDSDDMNKAFLKLWSLLEYLTFTEKENYNVTIDRALILFVDKFLYREKLELLRNKRNVAIHGAKQFDEAEKYTYMLMNIINRYLLFIINGLTKIKSIIQLKEVLDLSTTISKHEDLRNELDLKIENLNLCGELIRKE